MLTGTERSEHRFVTLRGGRRLAYAEYGDPSGTPVLVFHGMPGSRFQRHPDEAVARAAGARLIHFDRPGIGASDPAPARRLADWPVDVAYAADALNLGTFAVAGISGGGPYAIACAVVLGSRLTRVAVISGVGPPGSMSPAQMPMVARLGFAAATKCPWLLVGVAWGMARLATHYPDHFIDLASRQLCPADQVILARSENRAMLQQDLVTAFHQGPRGPREDFQLMARPWQLPLGPVASEIAFWHGEDDRLIPPSASEYLARAMGNAPLYLLRTEGHFVVLDRWPEMLGWLLR